MLAISELFSCREPSYLLNTWLLLTTREIEPWSGQRKTINLTALFLEQDFNETPLKKSSLKFDIENARNGTLCDISIWLLVNYSCVIQHIFFTSGLFQDKKEEQLRVKHGKKPRSCSARICTTKEEKNSSKSIRPNPVPLVNCKVFLYSSSNL